ncbi:MAG: hypothetical protein AMJ46_05685 [Latescibacteria bacterium DG_63]|nr:MAG: hypothetical protein AMJ46_05685 [Latescibacteria bacterium DG_63]
MPNATSLERIKRRAPNLLTVLKVVLPVTLGYLLGAAIVNPYHRTIEILVGFFIAAAAFLIKPSRAIAVFIVIFLFPAHLSIGTSNTVFILILLATWIAQQVLSKSKISVRTPLDVPILAMAVAYFLSLLNVQHGLYAVNFRGLSVFLTSLAVYYLVVNLTLDAAAIRRLLWAGAIGAIIMAGIGLYEIFNPGRQLLPYFLIMREAPSDVPVVRAGSGFRNASVLSQYCLFYILTGAFMFTRESSRFLRTVIALLLAASFIIFVSTAMRGALIAGFGGLAFLLWRGRGVFDTKKLALGVVACIVIFLVAHQVLTTAGFVPNIWERFFELQQKTGSHIDRAAVMREVFDKSMEHPLIGHGPVISLPRGFVTLRSNNPHCQYLLYLYTIGILGLAGFVWLLVGLFRLSSRGIRLGSPNKSLVGLMVILQTFLVIFVLHETVDDYSSSFNYPLFIWYTFALIVATRNVMLKEASLPAAKRETISSGSFT